MKAHSWSDYELFWFTLLGLTLLISLAHIVTYFALAYTEKYEIKSQRVFLLRTQRHLSTFWWVFLISALVSIFGLNAALVVCAILSFLGLREFITLTPVNRSDYYALFFAFFVFLPLQYILIGLHQFGVFSVLIPVYAFLLLPVFSVVNEDMEKFLSRKASLQWGLMIAVFCLSHTVAILYIDAVGSFSTQGRALLLLFFLTLVRFAMLLQHLCDYIFRHKKRIAAKLHSRMTWQGLLVGATANAFIASSFFWFTPLTLWQAAIAGALISLSSVFGRLVMRSITISLGIKDWGELTGGRQGVLDRLDAVLYAAPVFFHYVVFVTKS